MIKSLYDIIRDMDAQDYNYYDCNMVTINTDNISQENAKNFIYNYFSAGEKAHAVMDIGTIWNTAHERPIHTLLLFFLLINCYHNCQIKEILDKELETFKCTNKDRISLRFLFLLCLYHDYGYYFERRTDTEDRNIDIHFNELATLRQMNNEYFEAPYSKENIKIYFKKLRNKHEHGISGGTLLSLRLKKNFRKHKEQIKNGNIDSHNIVWNKKADYDFYDYIGSIIIKHNIWFATDEKAKEKYSKLGLTDLIINEDESNKLSYENNPILFIFCLLDTLEPTKSFIRDWNDGAEITRLLRSIKIEFGVTNGLKLSLPLKELDIMKTDEYICKLNGLMTWMQLNVSELRTIDTIELTFLF